MQIKKLEDSTIRPAPWTFRKATRGVGKWLNNYSLYDADGDYITGMLSLTEATLICEMINVRS